MSIHICRLAAVVRQIRQDEDEIDSEIRKRISELTHESAAVERGLRICCQQMLLPHLDRRTQDEVEYGN